MNLCSCPSRPRPTFVLVTLGTCVGGDAAEVFAYDVLNRLTQANDDDPIVRLTYDRSSRVFMDVHRNDPLDATGRCVRPRRANFGGDAILTWLAASNATGTADSRAVRWTCTR